MNDENGFVIELKTTGNTYRWVRNDGEWVSPTFTTLEAALHMQATTPFLTDQEWKDVGPPAEHSLLPRVAYTLTEFAKMFGKERTWAHHQVKKGRVAVIKKLGCRMVSASEIYRLLQNKK